MCAKRSPLRAQRCAARRLRLCVCPQTRPRTSQVLREQEGARVLRRAAEQASCRVYGDDEAAREAKRNHERAELSTRDVRYPQNEKAEFHSREGKVHCVHTDRNIIREMRVCARDVLRP